MQKRTQSANEVARSVNVSVAWGVVSGVSIIAFPIMLLVGFATHPNILSMSMVLDLKIWTSEWRTNDLFHIGHLIVMFAVPFIIFAAIALASLLRGRGAWHGFVGAILSVFGAFLLAVDKGALTFVLTAFKDMPDQDFDAITPALAAIFNREGWLWITWGYIALPIGFIILTIGLLREAVIRRLQGVCIIVGLLLLINPDIEIISSAGALLMCAGFVPIGWAFLLGRMTPSTAPLKG